jgi:hypothetical protein
MHGDSAQLPLEIGFAWWLGVAGRSEFLAPAINGQDRHPSCPEKGTEAPGLASVMINACECGNLSPLVSGSGPLSIATSVGQRNTL